jgi:glucokinase
MAAGCVIGVDLGGTKLLAGTVDPKLEVHHRAYRLARTDDAGALIDQLVEAVQEAAEAAPSRVLAVGLGIPCLVDPETGVALDSNHLPLHGCRRQRWQRGDARRVALGRGARRAPRDHADARHRHRRRAPRRRASGARRARSGGRARAHHRRRRRASVPGELPGPRLPGGACLRPSHRHRGAAARARRAQYRARARAGLGTRDHGRARHRTGPRRRSRGRRGDDAHGRAPGAGHRDPGQHLQPRGRRRRRGRDRRRGAAPGPGARGVARRALSVNRADVRLVAARFGAESGMLGAACMALDVAGVPVG